MPLVGSGVLSVRKIYPYALGSNLGTTVTAILAALMIASPMGVTIAFAHLVFNFFGILIFYPLKKIPIKLAEWYAKITSKSRRNTIISLIIYFLLHIIPLGIILIY